MSNVDPKLVELVNALPEFYQPIYGHSEWDDKPLRSCVDRVPVVKKVYDALSKALNRPLRVLDLGCAQGFFSLHIASWGGTVTAVDLRKQNIELGEFLASEHPDYKIRFVLEKVEHFLAKVNADDYDLVLCLSILHNVSRFFGLKNVQNLMQDLSQKVSGGVFEFALEKVHAAYIPKDYRDFLPGFSFIRDLSHSTHRDGSKVMRPICFASAKYTYFEELGALKIDSITYNVHSYLAKTDVMHFHCGDKFVKFFYLKPKPLSQRINAEREIEFLKTLGGQNGLPRLLAVHEEQGEAGKRLFIVRDKLEGITLAEKIALKEDFDRWDVTKQILKWMAFFEEHNYWHGDTRPNNFILSPDGKIFPIDYEEIRHESVVAIWPYRVSMLVFALINQILEPTPQTNFLKGLTRMLIAFKKHLSQRQYEQISNLEESADFFRRLYEILSDTKEEQLPRATYNMVEMEILLIEKYIYDFVRKNNKSVESLNSQVAALAEQVKSLSGRLDEQQNNSQVATLAEQVKSLSGRLDEQQNNSQVAALAEQVKSLSGRLDEQQNNSQVAALAEQVKSLSGRLDEQQNNSQIKGILLLK